MSEETSIERSAESSSKFGDAKAVTAALNAILSIQSLFLFDVAGDIHSPMQNSNYFQRLILFVENYVGALLIAPVPWKDMAYHSRCTP